MASNEPLVEFDRLNLLGKAVFLTGQVARAAGQALEFAVDQAAHLVHEAEAAFRDGLDDSVEDAKILEEHVDERRRRKS